MLPYSTIEQLRYGRVTSQAYFFGTGIEKTPANKVTVTTLGLVVLIARCCNLIVTIMLNYSTPFLNQRLCLLTVAMVKI
jgi:hypothetical protein